MVSPVAFLYALPHGQLSHHLPSVAHGVLKASIFSDMKAGHFVFLSLAAASSVNPNILSHVLNLSGGVSQSHFLLLPRKSWFIPLIPPLQGSSRRRTRTRRSALPSCSPCTSPDS